MRDRSNCSYFEQQQHPRQEILNHLQQVHQLLHKLLASNIYKPYELDLQNCLHNHFRHMGSWVNSQYIIQQDSLEHQKHHDIANYFGHQQCIVAYHQLCKHGKLWEYQKEDIIIFRHPIQAINLQMVHFLGKNKHPRNQSFDFHPFIIQEQRQD